MRKSTSKFLVLATLGAAFLAGLLVGCANAEVSYMLTTSLTGSGWTVKFRSSTAKLSETHTFTEAQLAALTVTASCESGMIELILEQVDLAKTIDITEADALAIDTSAFKAGSVKMTIRNSDVKTGDIRVTWSAE